MGAAVAAVAALVAVQGPAPAAAEGSGASPGSATGETDAAPAPAGDAAAFARVGYLLQQHCAMPACHAGPRAEKGMRLEADQVYRSTVNVRARTDHRYLRVEPGAPDRSLLLLKLLAPAEGHYRGPRMPLGMDPLAAEDVALIRRWIESFPRATWGAAPAAETEVRPQGSFHDRYLANLPTPETLGAKTLEFRISHRFRGAATDSGSRELYGLDTGAWISLELGYGLGDRVDVGLRRTNLQEDYEGYAKWNLVEQGRSRAPLSLALRGSISDARDRGAAHEWRYGAQIAVSRRIRDAVSLLLVPTYVSRTNSLDPGDSRGTAAIGSGFEWRLTHALSLTGEWVAQTSGVKAPYQGGAVGLSIGTARHVFHILLTNTPGVQTDLYAPGGDLEAGAGKYRLGFNISRTYGLGR